jgi:hypothetical protein
MKLIRMRILLTALLNWTNARAALFSVTNTNDCGAGSAHLIPSRRRSMLLTERRSVIQKLLVFLTCVAVVGCQSVNVKDVRSESSARETLAAAEKIYVRPFTMDNTVIKGDLGGSKKEGRLQQWPQDIAQLVVADLTPYKPCEVIGPDVKPDKGVVLEGNFDTIDGGSGAARFWVGMGAGESILRVTCRMHEASKPDVTLYEFQARGGSKAEGGLLGAMDTMDKNVQNAAHHIAKFVKTELGVETK